MKPTHVRRMAILTGAVLLAVAMLASFLWGKANFSHPGITLTVIALVVPVSGLIGYAIAQWRMSAALQPVRRWTTS
jgi:hypothetical protein